MAWLKVDDGFWSHPKTATLSDAAVTLWVRAGSYSCQHLTDGAIKRSVLRLLGTEDAAVELVDAGLWVPEEAGWSFHDWDEYQETSEAVKKRRADARDRQRRAREAREEKRAKSRSESRVTAGVSNAVSSLPPTRPDPTRPIEVPKGTSESEIAEAIRPDVEALLNLLDSELRANDVKKLPVRNKANVNAMRLLIDKDGYDAELVARIIRWCQADSFWRGNVMSAGKLREQFETLRAHANRKREERMQSAPSKSERAHEFLNELTGGGFSGRGDATVGGDRRSIGQDF